MGVLLRDFDAEIDRDRWYPSLDKFGVRKENSDGYGRLQFHSYSNLAITNTAFGHKMAHMSTWYSHDGKTANLIEYFIVSQILA